MEDALRKRDIPYRIYGGLSFYQRKEIKDVLAYLRVLVNPRDEESLKRIINYPARGIGQTTVDKLVVGAKQHNLSIFEVAEQAVTLQIGVNAGTAQKLTDFVTLIKSLQVFNENVNAFEIADEVTKRTRIVWTLKGMELPKGLARLKTLRNYSTE